MKTKDKNIRQSGILLPLASIPSKQGIGDFGPEAYEFVRIIAKMGFSIWQILPLNPASEGNSPYTPFSSFAGDEIYIDLRELKKKKLISKLEPVENTDRVDYEFVRSYKRKKLIEAFNNFTKQKNNKDEYKDFVKRAFWLDDYSLFMALRHKNNDKVWNEWAQEDQDHPSKKGLTKIINYHKFVQYIHFKQFIALHTYAKKHGITLLGDLPIYVGYNSSDVFNNRENFLLDDNNIPTFVSGASPDYFNMDGQLWNHPLYNWEYLKENNYEYWYDRFRWTNAIYDVVRIDHFRAFDTYWAVPYGSQTAASGHFEEGPSYHFFDSIYQQYPQLNIIVEDLGDIRNQVEELRDYYHLMGMKVIQYCFDQDYAVDNYQLPENCVVYTGTHDNAPIKGWYNGLLDYDKERVYNILRSFDYPMYDVDYLIIYHVLASKCKIAFVTVQDLLGKGNESRYNFPGKESNDNWTWRLENFDEFKTKYDIVRIMLENTKRIN